MDLTTLKKESFLDLKCPVDLATGGQDDRHSRSVEATLVVSTHTPLQ